MPSSASPPPAIYPLSLHDALPICRPLALHGHLVRDRQLPAALPARLHRHHGDLHPPGRRSDRRAEPVPQGLSRRRGEVSHGPRPGRSEEHTSELQSLRHLVCRLLLRPPPRSTPFPYTTLFRSVDLSRYTGTWYEIASFPQRFQRGCTATTATYTLRDDGQIAVLNRCRKGSPDGEEKSATGRARVDRKSTRLNSSHLGISYAVFCFAPPRDLPPFPTRRSSDLSTSRATRAPGTRSPASRSASSAAAPPPRRPTPSGTTVRSPC